MRNFLIIVALSLSQDVFSQHLDEINSNNVFSYITNSSRITNTQIGNNNSIELLLNNKIESISVLQLGNNNNLQYIDPVKNDYIITNDYLIKGSNNSVVVYGTNSISQNMNLDVAANNKTITIINR